MRCSLLSWVLSGLLLASLLAFSAYQIVAASVYDLLDRSLEESLGIIIENGLEEYAGQYQAVHGLRSRKSGGHTYIELFLEFPGYARMADVQQLMNRMQRELETKIPNSHIVIVPSDQPVEAFAVQQRALLE